MTEGSVDSQEEKANDKIYNGFCWEKKKKAYKPLFLSLPEILF